MLVEHKSDCHCAKAEAAAQLQLYLKGTCPVKDYSPRIPACFPLVSRPKSRESYSPKGWIYLSPDFSLKAADSASAASAAAMSPRLPMVFA